MAKRLRRRLVLAVTAVSVSAAALPALASAGTISGTVTEAGSGTRLGGVKVCSHVNPYTFEDTCTTTDASGDYALTSLPAGEYAVHFDDSGVNRNVVSQYYGGSDFYPGTRVTLAGPGDTLSGIDAELPEGSTIAGTVTDASSGLPIAGIPVCAYAEHGLDGPTGRCESSESTGAYAIRGLPPGDYEVEFQSGLLNYQPQRFDGSAWPEPPTLVPIGGPGEMLSGKTAAMEVGVEISGRLTEAGTGQPLAGIPVELLQPGKESSGFIVTDANGQYVYRGLREGEYILAFSTPHGPFGTDIDCFATQYYKGATTLAGATVLAGVPGTALTGIDAELTRTCPKPGPPPLQVSFAPATTRVGAVKRKVRCRRGFQRKRVKGELRCVKRHRRHRRRKHGRR